MCLEGCDDGEERSVSDAFIYTPEKTDSFILSREQCEQHLKPVVIDLARAFPSPALRSPMVLGRITERFATT